MGIRAGRTPKHWNYFLSIEEDVAELSRWIEFHEDNFGCFSIQTARLLMASAAEVDVIAKRLAKDIDSKIKAFSINRYREVIVNRYPQLPQSEVEMPRYGLTLKPWINWAKQDNPPCWWSANNKVKHHRSDFFNEASLEHCLNAVAGLFLILALYYGRDERSVTPAPSVFEPSTYAYIDGDWLVFMNQV